MDLYNVRFSSAFKRFFLYDNTRDVLFCAYFYMSISEEARLSYTGQKFSVKIFCERVLTTLF